MTVCWVTDLSRPFTRHGCLCVICKMSPTISEHQVGLVSRLLIKATALCVQQQPKVVVKWCSKELTAARKLCEEYAMLFLNVFVAAATLSRRLCSHPE